MREPPFLIDGTRVLAYVALGPAPAATVADGVTLEARAAAVTESLADGALFLLYCNEDWETLAAEPRNDLASAQRAVSAQFPKATWQPYRALTPAEAAEVETTRTFLQELARDFPGEG